MKKELVVIIHGFAGNPWEIHPLADVLEKNGYKVMTPLLPGHNLNNQRLEKANSRDWILFIEKIIEQSIRNKKKIHLIGFSMGSMIASVIASRYQIRTLILLSPAVYVLTPNVLKMKLEKFFQTRKKNRAYTTVLNDQSLMHSASIYHLYQFQKTVRQAKRIFHHISIPICIIHGKKDETVDPKGSEFIYHAVSSNEKELHFLPFSRHHICRDCESDNVNQIVVKFLKKYH